MIACCATLPTGVPTCHLARAMNADGNRRATSVGPPTPLTLSASSYAHFGA